MDAKTPVGKKPPTRAKVTKPAKKGGAAASKTAGPTKSAGSKPGAKPAPKSSKPAAGKAGPKSASKSASKSGGKAAGNASGPKSGAGKSSADSKKSTAKSPATGPVKSAGSAKAAGDKAPAKGPAKAGDKRAAAGGPVKAPAAPSKGPAGKGGGKAGEAVPAGKPGGKPAVTKPGEKVAEVAEGALGPDGKPVRKGITIVSNKPRRTGPKQVKIQIPKNEPLLGPGSRFRKPLIASGPGAVRKSLEIDPEALAKLRSPFNKKELQRFRDILIKKRADLVGDVSDLESEALLGRSGSLSALPQHLAEQGSETYEQSLSLNLAAEDRRLIREIDGALQRIDKGTFGICEMTGKTITRERLEELPWTRYSIEAAREFERRSMGR